MTQKEKILDTVILGAAVLFSATLMTVVIQKLLFKKRKFSQTKRASSSSGININTSRKFRCVSRSYPLTFGTCHPDIGILQRHLIRLGADLGNYGSNNDGVDNMYGSKTYEAARAYLEKTFFTKSDINQLA